MMQTQPSLHSAPSTPSFSGHSSESFPHSDPNDNDNDNDTLLESCQQNDHAEVSDDFEFSFVSRHADSSPVSADDIFYNGQIKPLYPVLHASFTSVPIETTRRQRLSLRTLMFEERETLNDNNQLDGVAEGTYCVWTPPCNKTTSSFKRWKIRDFLPRSHSDDKRTSKVASKHTSAAKFVGFFANANGLVRNLQLSS